MGFLDSRHYHKLVTLLAIPALQADFFGEETGSEYGLGFGRKLRLFLTMARNSRKIQSVTNVLEHAAMVTQVLRLPKSTQGCIVECGCFKGGSTSNLSLACAIASRRLEVFDSFQGLPEPAASDAVHAALFDEDTVTYRAGDYCGGLEEVQANIRRYGRIECCSFHPGFFERTLPGFSSPIALMFLDVDLIDSLKTCLLHLWPLLQENCRLYTHEARDGEYAKLFYDNAWWRESLGCDAPGLVGAGTGLGLVARPGGFISDLGYTVKKPSPRRC